VAGVPEVDLTHIGGAAQSATDLKDFADAGYDPATNKVQGVVLADTVTTYTGNTPQTGDNFARIGAAGASLTDLGGMSTGMKAEVESEANDALVAQKLDHLVAVADADDAVDNCIIAKLAASGATADWSTFVNTTDSLQAIRDRGDAEWITATGFSTHSAADIWSVATRALTDKSGFALSATGANLILKDSTFALAIADAIWDEILTGATHNIATSAGRRVREIGAYAIESGTAQAGNSHSITLAATASATDGTYNRNLIVLTDSTGIGQTRTIVDYNGTTKVAVIDRDWRTSPDATTEYQVTPNNTALVVDQGVAQAGSATTITLRAYASAVNDAYLCNVVAIIAGTGRGQARLVGGYVGATKVVTICGDNWVTNPDATSVYVMMPYGTTCTSCIGTHALGLIKSENDDALTDIHLDHLLAANYDPASKPGVATALLNELVENDGGVSRYTANALEQAPGGSAPTVGQIRAEMEGVGYFLDLIKDDTDELQTDWHDGGRLDLIQDIIAADTTTDIPALILKYTQLLARSDAAIATDNATELTAINADGGSGAGDFSNQTDAVEAIRDRGDAAWSAAAGNPNVLIDTTIAAVTDQTHFTLTAGSDVDDAYKDQAIVLYDASNSDYPSVRKVSAYTGATKTVTLDSAPDFTIVNGDGVKTFVTAPGTTAPTAAQNADAVWDEPKADHPDPTTFGGQNSFVNG
jgi:hypothetical protein